MNRPRRNRHRAGGLLLSVVGLLAAVGALAGFAVAKDGGRHAERHHGRHHGHHDRGPSGTIKSFDPATGKLTIALPNEETVTGLVTDRTRIKCEDEHAPDVTASRRHLRHGEAEAGDDHGGRGEEEPGDDHGGADSVPSHSGSGPSGHDDNGTGANCTTSDLIVGAVVTSAELEIEHGGADWDEVELAS
jgi:hypothetical protein